MKHLLRSIAIAAVTTTLLLAGFTFGFYGQAHAEKTYKFTMQNMFSLNHPISIAVEKMGKDIKAESNGQIDIQVLPSGALVGGPNIFESVGNGAINMGTSCSCYHDGILPVAATAFALPGDPRGVDQIIDFIYKDEVLKFYRDAYAKVNVFYAAPMVMDGYTIVSKKPIQTWEDLKKLKVRASGSIAKTLQKMGIPTVFIPFSEIYVALSRGTIDAEISGSHAESFLAGTYEVAKYQTTPEISGAQNCEVIINLDSWKELPDNLKAIFEKNLKSCSAHVASLFAAENKEVRGKMEAKGAQYIELPKDVMQKWTTTAIGMWDEELSKDPLSAQYIELVKKDLKSRGYDL
ncbi:MAG: TRAP transporter substrate-binding protein DctP [Desulfamplus sp.]|nr:TRAP transporter substrate-binding protein DctP [Desulfamplus sp.]